MKSFRVSWVFVKGKEVTLNYATVFVLDDVSQPITKRM